MLVPKYALVLVLPVYDKRKRERPTSSDRLLILLFGWELSILEEEEEKKNTTKRICDNVVNIIEILKSFSFLLVCSFFVWGFRSTLNIEV